MELLTNKQEIFDTVVTKLKAQGRVAKMPNGACMYRTADGRACGIGLLLPDDRVPNGGSILSLIGNGLFPEWNGMSDFMQDIQSAHDGARYDHQFRFKDVWKEAEYDHSCPNSTAGIATHFSKVARDYGLNTDVLHREFPKEESVTNP